MPFCISMLAFSSFFTPTTMFTKPLFPSSLIEFESFVFVHCGDRGWIKRGMGVGRRVGSLDVGELELGCRKWGGWISFLMFVLSSSFEYFLFRFLNVISFSLMLAWRC